MIAGRNLRKLITTGLVVVLSMAMTVALIAQDRDGNRPGPGRGSFNRGDNDRPGPRGRQGAGPRRGPDSDRGFPGRPGRDRLPEKLTEEQVKEALKTLGEIDPEQSKRVEYFLKTKPEQARMLLRRSWPWLKDLVVERKKYPDLFNARRHKRHLERQMRGTIFRLRQVQKGSNAAAVKAAEKRLRQLLTERFRANQTIRRWELKKVEDSIAGLKAEIDKNEKNKDQLIEKELAGMLKPQAPTPQTSAGHTGE